MAHAWAYHCTQTQRLTQTRVMRRISLSKQKQRFPQCECKCAPRLCSKEQRALVCFVFFSTSCCLLLLSFYSLTAASSWRHWYNTIMVGNCTNIRHYIFLSHELFIIFYFLVLYMRCAPPFMCTHPCLWLEPSTSRLHWRQFIKINKKS